MVVGLEAVREGARAHGARGGALGRERGHAERGPELAVGLVQQVVGAVTALGGLYHLGAQAAALLRSGVRHPHPLQVVRLDVAHHRAVGGARELGPPVAPAQESRDVACVCRLHAPHANHVFRGCFASVALPCQSHIPYGAGARDEHVVLAHDQLVEPLRFGAAEEVGRLGAERDDVGGGEEGDAAVRRHVDPLEAEGVVRLVREPARSAERHGRAGGQHVGHGVAAVEREGGGLQPGLRLQDLVEADRGGVPVERGGGAARFSGGLGRHHATSPVFQSMNSSATAPVSSSFFTTLAGARTLTSPVAVRSMRRTFSGSGWKRRISPSSSRR